MIHPKRNTHPGTRRKRSVSTPQVEEHRRRVWLTPETGADAREQQVAGDFKEDVGHEAAYERIEMVSLVRALWIA